MAIAQQNEKQEALPRRWIVEELWLVFGLSLGTSGIYSALQLIQSLQAPRPLGKQSVAINSSVAPGHPWFDLIYQLLGTGSALIPVLVALYLLKRSAESRRVIGLDGSRPKEDLRDGTVLAVVVGGAGLAFYLITQALGLDLTVVPENLPAIWWRYPVLLLEAFHNGLLEEVLVVGFLLHRLKQLGWSDNKSLLTSSLLRGSYHLYQGVGGAAGNFVMGLIFGRLYQRYGRVTPLVVAHTLMDAVAFCGYAALAHHVSWIPVPK